ncbi:MAG TPA: protein translocase subunit SecF [Actinomycetota bacterium]|nr:protein translocase subunit SecF [Actinomycetota bacterium]
MREKLRRIYRGETNVDFIGRRKVWFALSALVVGLCVLTLGTQGLNYGIEFEGGVQLQAEIAEDGPLAGAGDQEVIAAVRESLAEEGAESSQIQVASSGSSRTVLVQTKEVADPERQAAVIAAVSRTVGASPAETDSQRIGSQWGGEITAKAIRALIIFFIVVFAFISWRFEVKMAVAALIALVHDMTITAGIYSLLGFEVTPSSVIALLTILGYSLYDTVVVFDKVEEDTSAYAATGRMTYQDAANRALNEVFMRSLNTSLSTILPVAALLLIGAGLLGASTLEDLALALLIGLIVGSYSSVFLATPILSLWKEREPRYRNVREKVLREARRVTALPTPAAATLGADASERAPSAQATARTTTRPPTRSRAGSRKAKRRRRR